MHARYEPCDKTSQLRKFVLIHLILMFSVNKECFLTQALKTFSMVPSKSKSGRDASLPDRPSRLCLGVNKWKSENQDGGSENAVTKFSAGTQDRNEEITTARGSMPCIQA